MYSNSVQSDSFSISVNITLVTQTYTQSELVYNSIVETISSNTETIKASAPIGYVAYVNASALKPPLPLNPASVTTATSTEAMITTTSNFHNVYI